MAAKKPKKTRWSVQVQLVKKAREDAAFRQKLMRNPNAAIKEALGVTVPKGITVEVVQEKPNKLYLVLPVNPKDLELPDEMPSKVAGGGAAGCYLRDCECGMCFESRSRAAGGHSWCDRR